MQKARLSSLRRASLNLVPLTGIAFAINLLIGKLNLKIGLVKTTRMTTFLCMGHSGQRALV